MRLTRHGRERLRGRMGLSGGAPERMAQRALEHGLPPAAFVGRLRRYLDGRMLLHPGGCNLRVYGEAVYVFDAHEALVTVLQVPRDMRAAALAKQREAAS